MPPVPKLTPPLSASTLQQLVPQIQPHAYAPGTFRNLHSQWKSFLHFCCTYRLVPLPASPHTVASYASYLACKTSSFQYILNHLNAVRLLHLYNGFSADALDSFVVSLTKRGLKRLLGTATRQKHPITPAILHQFHQQLSLELPSHTAVWALFCTAFSFLRKSNLTVASFGSFQPSRHLARAISSLQSLEPSFVFVGPRPCTTVTSNFW